jgi:uncharacterized protein (DUF1684 family)
VAAACFVLAALSASAAEDTGYVQSIEAYRRDREQRLRGNDGWLTLVGLFWLESGKTAFGADRTLPIALPAGPPKAGTLELAGDTVRLRAEPGVALSVGGKAVTDRVLADDAAGKPDIVELDRLRFHVIRRGDRFGVRVKDPQAPTRKNFRGLTYYPVDPAWRVVARFERYESPRPVEVATVAGVVEKMTIPGKLTFELGGANRTLEPLLERPYDTELFLIFRDTTSGSETYGAGRYLYATVEGSTAVIDFNRAYNPPCAFTPYATCPLPPRGNRLDVPIRAGEKRYGDH